MPNHDIPGATFAPMTNDCQYYAVLEQVNCSFFSVTIKPICILPHSLWIKFLACFISNELIKTLFNVSKFVLGFLQIVGWWNGTTGTTTASAVPGNYDCVKRRSLLAEVICDVSLVDYYYG